MPHKVEYRNQAEGRNDGSGMVDHDFWVLRQVEGEWVHLPSLHKTVVIPATVLLEAMEEPTTGAKANAYRQAIREYANAMPAPTQWPSPPSIWEEADLAAYGAAWDAAEAQHQAANALADQAAVAVHAFISGLPDFEGYPYTFDL